MNESNVRCGHPKFVSRQPRETGAGVGGDAGRWPMDLIATNGPRPEKRCSSGGLILNRKQVT